jgi:hypothetical protein
MKTSQTGWLIIGTFFPITLILVFLLFKVGIRDTTGTIILGSVMAIMFACLLIFYKLTISINTKELKLWFGFGLVSKKYQLTDIKNFKPVTNSPLYGWGIRMIPDGWLYNVTGLKAIELSFKQSPKKIRIGTNLPEEIAAYVNQLLDKPQSNVIEETEPYNFRKPLFWSILIISVLFVGFILFYGMQETKVNISSDSLQIKGMYGLVISLTEVDQVDTVSKMPKIILRTNGFALGRTLKGHFKLEDQSKVLLFVECNNHPYIRIKFHQENTLYLNLNNASATREVFQKLSAAVGAKR